MEPPEERSGGPCSSAFMHIRLITALPWDALGCQGGFITVAGTEMKRRRPLIMAVAMTAVTQSHGLSVSWTCKAQL